MIYTPAIEVENSVVRSVNEACQLAQSVAQTMATESNMQLRSMGNSILSPVKSIKFDMIASLSVCGRKNDC